MSVGRAVHHHAYIERAYDANCDDLDANAGELVEAATRTAAAFAADLAGYLENRLGFFDRDERVDVVVGEIDRSKTVTVVGVAWRADDTRRLLPNVEASVHITPIISSGPGATSEITLRGTYNPPRTAHRGLVEHVLARRVVDASLHTFLRHLADGLARRAERP